MKISKEFLIETLQSEVNSALLNVGNHESDNSFIEPTLGDFAKRLEEYDLEPLGISHNAPFGNAAYDAVAFAIKNSDGDIYWCHLPQLTWFNLSARSWVMRRPMSYLEQSLLAEDTK